ncbi:MAG: S8 family serine peptidase, partial [Acidimicrobiia bacterium]
AAGTPASDSAFQVSGDRQPFVVILADDPVVAYEGDIPGLARTKPARGQKVNPDSPAVRAYRQHLDEKRAQARSAAGIEAGQVVATYDFALVGFSAALTEGEAEILALQKNVISVYRDELLQIQTDTSPDFLGLTDGGGAYDSGIDGSGVIVGVIDTGIWPEHPSFADDGSYTDPGVSVPCEFGDTAHNPDDAPFTCNNKMLGARDMRALYNEFIGPELYNSARDADGHGSHTAGTAAGNADIDAEIFGIERGTISGIAPRAHVISYKGCGDLGCFSGDLADAIDQSVADGVDVINYSIGSATPAITGADDIAFLFAADAGVFVATSNGNSGPEASTVGSPAAAPWLTAVGASHHDRMFQGTVTLGNGDQFFGASVTDGVGPAQLVDGAALRNELCDPDVKFRPAPVGQIVLCKGAVGRAAKSRAVLEQGGVGMILYNDAAHQTLPSDNHYVPTVHVSNADGLAIKDYIASAGKGKGKGKDKGAAVTAEASLTAGVAVQRPVAPFMAYFSSRGPVGLPASADIIKPDVTAPGVQILAANSPAPGFDVGGELFMAIQGTSMSSPHVAGLFALLKEAHPDWSAAAAKSALMTTAYQEGVFKEDQTTPADPFDIGAGHVDGSGNASAANSMFNPGLVYDAGFFDYLGFLCDVAPEVFPDPSGTCGFLESEGVPTTSENLNYPSIGASEVPGTLTVERTVTNVTGKSLRVNAVVEAPEGYSVSVSPSTLRVPARQSRSFEITFNNVSGPVGEFRFGSLTWQGQGYAVRSPIAVAAAALDAPDTVTGTGTTGSTSFDVTFGYSGEYDATAHGLAIDVPIVGSVSQDPDQEFDPGDPTGTTQHTFSLSGTAAFRLTLDTDDLTPPDPEIDLDLYLFRDGQFVASSTAGSTQELIQLMSPEDGTYTLFVHGWQTTGETVGYNIHTWDVPAVADAGSLVIDSEPADAEIGVTATIDVSWSGLTAGTNYLGMVGHHDADGLIDVTFVEVSTE